MKKVVLSINPEPQVLASNVNGAKVYLAKTHTDNDWYCLRHEVSELAGETGYIFRLMKDPKYGMCGFNNTLKESVQKALIYAEVYEFDNMDAMVEWYSKNK